MIGYDVSCYRCRIPEHGSAETEAEARSLVTDYQRRHRSSCGDGASFSISVYSMVVGIPETLLGVVEPPELPEAS